MPIRIKNRELGINCIFITLSIKKKVIISIYCDLGTLRGHFIYLIKPVIIFSKKNRNSTGSNKGEVFPVNHCKYCNLQLGYRIEGTSEKTLV